MIIEEQIPFFRYKNSTTKVVWNYLKPAKLFKTQQLNNALKIEKTFNAKNLGYQNSEKYEIEENEKSFDQKKSSPSILHDELKVW